MELTSIPVSESIKIKTSMFMELSELKSFLKELNTIQPLNSKQLGETGYRPIYPLLSEFRDLLQYNLNHYNL
jgi:hypothetical protein